MMVKSQCVLAVGLMCVIAGTARGVDRVAILDDPNMFGAGWYTAVSGSDMDNGSAWVATRDEWAFLGTLQMSTLFGVAALPPVYRRAAGEGPVGPALRY